MSGASERANGRASGQVLASGLLVILAHSAVVLVGRNILVAIGNSFDDLAPERVGEGTIVLSIDNVMTKIGMNNWESGDRTMTGCHSLNWFVVSTASRKQSADLTISLFE